ncbi:MAG: hypothetical protein J5701_01700 [Bacteroidales bacterium]|nr:hypothetical protein [Bacteroidales bacterium]
MKLKIGGIGVLLCFICVVVQAQTVQEKRERRANLTLKEWNTLAGHKTRYLDHITKYDAKGFKIEEIEYASYGQKYRITYEYNDAGKCIREVEYDSKNKPIRIRKFEYYADGSKKRQYNYLPNGKLISSKEFEYIFSK